jgi:dephospho-CoA kinase
MLRVGLTGGIASGKSTIMRMFAGLGCITVDADSVVARLYRAGEAGHEALVRTYGKGILLPDGEVDRKRLADIAFSSPEEAQRLNALIHPIVLAEEARRMREAEEREDDAIYVVEATLLLESGGKDRYDRIVVVDVPTEVQIERGVARGMTREEVTRRIAHQMSREERARHADYIIDNSGDERQALAGTTRVYEALVADLSQKKKRPGRAPGADSKNS